MPSCHTDCIEKPVSNWFHKLGGFVGRNPWWFLLVPLFISAGLGAGFYFLEEREAHGIEDQFTPKDGPAKKERHFVKEHFPQNDSEFSRLRLYTEGSYGSFIAVSKSSDILSEKAFEEIIYLDGRVREMGIGHERLTYENLCAMKKLGGVVLNSSIIVSAKAVRLFYFLRENNKAENDIWLHGFTQIQVSYFTSNSREEELKGNSKSVIPLFSVAYFLAISFSMISCLRLDCVRNKVWVASFGALSAGLAVLSSFGLLLLCGMPFAMTVATAPFLILGIGVDDMFIMISCWQQTQVHDNVEDRMAATYKDAAISITITTLTDALAFYIGLLTPFGSVQSFCMYTGTAVLFCYLYNITFFGAFLALNGRREKGNRHWLTCMKVPEPEDSPEKYNICCVGGAYDQETGKEEVMPINNFFKMYYGPFLTNTWTKVFVILLYAGYLGSSIYGCFQIQEGIDLKNLAANSSYVGSYYDNEDQYFSQYGPNVMVVVTDSEFQYWNESFRNSLDSCLQNFGGLSMVSQNMIISWLDEYLKFGKMANLSL
ncbi:unnamed protein product [Coregonus sp. 'balchen']|nr:unnamed protein product [Coregonus sp. 'balchen']